MNVVDEPSTSSVTTPPPMCSSSYSSVLCRPVKRIVSQNRRRYQQDGFDLDLTYITDRIIAMGYPSPSDTKESLYRNSMEHTVQFLDTYHHGHYKVFNLRGQFVYDVKRFHGRVESFEMTDHHPPRLELMAPFCRKVHEWLDQDPRNVVAVHCKAGKGRTGVMICAYLTYISLYPSPRQNMDYYSCVRTLNNKGVTIPSQRRYVYYFSHLRRNKLNYFPLRTQLIGVYVERPPKISSRTTRGGVWLRLSNVDVPVFTGDPIFISVEETENEDQLRRAHPLSRGPDHFDSANPYDNPPSANCISRRCYGWTVPESKPVFLEGDVRLDLYQKTTVLGVTAKDRGKIGHIWFNTMFCCPSFCGQPFMHGDEAHPYPNLSASPPAAGESTATTPSVGAKETRNRTPRNGRNSNGVKKIVSVDDSGAQQVNKSNGEKQLPPRRAISALSTPRTSKDGKLTEADAAGMTLAFPPPGLSLHCPDPNLIYGHNPAPRYRIQQQVLAAHNAGLLRDIYNERRLSESQPPSASLLPKAPVGRPTRGGPVCIERQPDEHVSTFSVLEIDRACKNKNLDTSFKVHIITRCIDPSDEEMKRVSEAFISETLLKQKAVDDKRGEELAHRQRRLDSSSSDKDSSKESPAVCPVVSVSVEKTEEMTWECDDERRRDSRYERFFFRQRVDSQSTHPPVRHQCPLVCSATPRQEKTMSMDVDEHPSGLRTVRSAPCSDVGNSSNQMSIAAMNDASANTAKGATSHQPTVRSSIDTPRSGDQRCHTDIDLNEPPTTSSDSFTDESSSTRTDDAESTDVEEVTTTAL